ncbi:hypothetical protein GQ43DRAFT_484739 [Delitschia confertaspora ATCC 74209]|uniref:GPI anchored cell wall protein n=1 Tax=Delitschia confertaspora ATCC 74209 TaxID=1513339 RepID=A0A9P4JF24_9PLEO|nr:hypothetical protein GQ43DRAFT_484739 [Delitschia confertaspora ATCC 74209]
MKAYTTIAALLSLFSSVLAATVTLKETVCIQSNTELETFTIPVNELAVKELKSVCGLQILSADGVDVSTLVCRAYKDAAGTQPGSAQFTFDTPALISTNPVQEASIKCDNTGTSNGTVSMSIQSSSQNMLPTAAPSGSSSPFPVSNSTSPSSTGINVPVGPASSTGAGMPISTAAASQWGPSIGVVSAAFAILFL